MRVVGTRGQILCPPGLMPHPTAGTVTPNLAKAVESANAGQVPFRTYTSGIQHSAIGKASFAPDAIKLNLLSLLAAVNKSKPAASKGVFLKKLTISTTMGPGIRVDASGL